MRIQAEYNFRKGHGHRQRDRARDRPAADRVANVAAESARRDRCARAGVGPWGKNGRDTDIAEPTRLVSLKKHFSDL